MEIESEGPARDDKINIGDKLNIQVYRERDLSGTFIVNPSGNINYPLIGEVHAVGLTVDELKQFLAETLGETYVVNPQIEINLEESPNKQIVVLGQVLRPGSYKISSADTTLIRVISQAGGFSDDALLKNVQIVRTKDGKRNNIQVDVSDIIRGGAPDTTIEAGDVIFVDKQEKKAAESAIPNVSVAILGQIQRPGNFSFNENTTLVRLVTQAGGFTPIAAPNRIKIVKFDKNGKSKPRIVNFNDILDGKLDDIKLESGDVVVVPESIF
jgi:polysaccharide export outer membrane protein